jgi:hypothetical protein
MPWGYFGARHFIIADIIVIKCLLIVPVDGLFVIFENISCRKT